MVKKLQSEHIKKITGSVGTPVFVYLEETILDNIHRIRDAISSSGIENKIKIYVSYFTNSNPHISAILQREGVGLTLQSPEENEHLKEHELSIEKVVSPTHLSKKNIEYFINEGIQVNYVTLSNLEEALKHNIAKPSIRVDLSPESNQRQGIKPEQFKEVNSLLKKYKKSLYGIQMYTGTGSDLDVHSRYQIRALECLKHFPELKEINLGGGFNFDYNNSKNHFDWKAYFNELQKRIYQFGIQKKITFDIEPGRDVLADTGLFIVNVTGIEKIVGKSAYEIFTDGSYTHMPSATIRARQHKLQFYDEKFAHILEETTAENPGFLSGNTTLSSDRLFPGIIYFPARLKEGDYIVLEDTGAYCATQHMEFLNKAPCPEVLIRKDGELELMTERGKLTDKIRYVLKSPRKMGDSHEN